MRPGALALTASPQRLVQASRWANTRNSGESMPGGVVSYLPGSTDQMSSTARPGALEQHPELRGASSTSSTGRWAPGRRPRRGSRCARGSRPWRRRTCRASSSAPAPGSRRERGRATPARPGRSARRMPSRTAPSAPRFWGSPANGPGRRDRTLPGRARSRRRTRRRRPWHGRRPDEGGTRRRRRRSGQVDEPLGDVEADDLDAPPGQLVRMTAGTAAHVEDAAAGREAEALHQEVDLLVGAPW